MGLEKNPISLVPYLEGQMTIEEVVKWTVKRIEYLIEEELKNDIADFTERNDFSHEIKK